MFIIVLFFNSCFQASKPQTSQAASHNKYLPLRSPLSPFSIPAWSTGLQAINQSPSFLVNDLNLGASFVPGATMCFGLSL